MDNIYFDGRCILYPFRRYAFHSFFPCSAHPLLETYPLLGLRVLFRSCIPYSSSTFRIHVIPLRIILGTVYDGQSPVTLSMCAHVSTELSRTARRSVASYLYRCLQAEIQRAQYRNQSGLMSSPHYAIGHSCPSRILLKWYTSFPATQAHHSLPPSRSHPPCLPPTVARTQTHCHQAPTASAPRSTPAASATESGR